MNHYQQTLVIDADPGNVYAALTTEPGLRGWWTRDCDVATGVGATLRFRFGPNHKAMRIEALIPDREVRWLCIEAQICGNFVRKDEWVGTRIVFRLTPAGTGRTRLDFEHIGLVPALECYEACDKGWRHFMQSLRQLVETGRGTPYEPAAVAAA